MRKHLPIILALILLSSISPVWASTSEWNYTYDGIIDRTATVIVQTADSGYAVMGIGQYAIGSLERNLSLVKVDSLGRMEWNRTFTLYGDSYFSSLIATSDGGFALAGGHDFASYGKQYNLNGRGVDFWLLKTDQLGNPQWNRTYGGSWHESANSLVQTDDGGFALAGYTWSFDPEGIWLVKTDSLGNMQWNQTYGLDNTSKMLITKDKGFILLGGYPETVSIIKTSITGSVMWGQTINPPSGEDFMPKSIVQTSDGGFAILGTASHHLYFDYCWITKIDVNGDKQWSRNYTEAFNSMVETSKGFILSGSMFSPVANGSLSFLARTDATGFLQSNQTFGGIGDFFGSLIKTSDAGVAVTGNLHTSEVGGKLWIIKTDENIDAPQHPIPAPTLNTTGDLPSDNSRFLAIGIGAVILVVITLCATLYRKKRGTLD